MKLAEHVEAIRQLSDNAFRNRLGRMGITASGLLPVAAVPAEYLDDRSRLEKILDVLEAETGTNLDAFEKLIEEITFTFFNRIAALKVMEAHRLHPEIITRQTQHGDRSFAHLLWLEQNAEGRLEEQEGLVRFLESQLAALADDIPFFSPQHPYHLLPTAIELNSILKAFNKIEADPQVENNIWQSDDVLGWLYESYNNYKKIAHKESNAKTEYNKVSIQSQVYTPRWVVKFLVDNSLGKLYLEMFPDSALKQKYKIANVPTTRTREIKSLLEIKMIDPVVGSGNFVLYSFDLFYDMYLDQIENYGASYDKDKIPELIILHNLHGIDLDDRAVQLAQLGLYIKAKRIKRDIKIPQFNIVSSDFYLPDFANVKPLFESAGPLDSGLEKIVLDLWNDLQQAHRFGSLLRLEEKLNHHLNRLVQPFQKPQVNLFSELSLANNEQFRDNFFHDLKNAVSQHIQQQGVSFTNLKTVDAIIFLDLLTQKYDVAVANPPYTDSGDFGPKLKKFMEDNYKVPFKFNINLYAAFIKRCYELVDSAGYLALIHPHTYMFIKTFEDVRRFIIQNTHIDVLVDYGLDRVNLFGPGILLDATWYVLSKKVDCASGLYFNITSNQQEKHKQASLEKAYEDWLCKRCNERVYTLDQDKLKIIEGWPFIYWISDGFREKFKERALENFANNSQGMSVSNGEKYQRFHWEITREMISFNYKIDKKKWVPFAKGGPFNKWYGNNWLLVNWFNDGSELKNFPKAAIRNQQFYFIEGLTYSSSGSKGSSFRYLPANSLFSGGGPSITLKNDVSLLDYLCGFLNSQLCVYLLDCLNPTVNTTQGDLNRIPFVNPPMTIKENVSFLSLQNIEIKKHLCSFHIIETNFEKTPLTANSEANLKDRIFEFLISENNKMTLVLLNEAVINALILEVYELSHEDRMQVETKMAKPVGSLPLSHELRNNNDIWDKIINELSITKEQKEFVENLPIAKFDKIKINEIKKGFANLYQSNNNLEEFCIRHQVNPINVWYWFKETKVLPPARAAEIVLEFLADALRTILAKDEDGIIPLVGLPGEQRLLDRLEKHCLTTGFSSAQFMQLDSLLGRPLNEYLEHYFFKDLSDHLNLFMYLPKTPFIWHLSSGEHQGLELYVSIYKWNRDSLYKLKTSYISKRMENLEYRRIQLQNSNTAQAQNEKEQIRLQLQEIAEFTRKVDELIAEGYDPKLDDGVGKNIAPLQKKGMLRCEVLNEKQLDRYLKADW